MTTHTPKAELPTTIEGWVEYTQTIHARSIDLTLDRVIEVRDRLNLGELSFHAIAVAGTNGKGSTVAMLESIYRAAGYSTGAYTSPHLVHYNERIRINGQSATDHAILESFNRVEAARGDTTLTYFEFGTLAALDQLSRSNIDIALLEVGLGGRLDAVRAFPAALSLVTSIGLDHQDWLGDTREEIGAEKAGIAQPGRPIICCDLDPPASIASAAQSIGAMLLQSGVDFSATAISDTPGARVSEGTWKFSSPLLGDIDSLPAPSIPGVHQVNNAAGVVAAIALMQDRLAVTDEVLRQGLSQVTLAGRLQILRRDPMVVLDVSHNAEAVKSLAEFLQINKVTGKTRIVLGMLGDKPVETAVSLLSPVVDEWFVCGLDVDRGTDTSQTVSRVAQGDAKTPIHSAADPVLAYKAALAASNPSDRVVVFGSFHTVGDILGGANSPV